MTRDTYERALKSAAQIAFLSSLSLAAGCGATPGEGAESQAEQGAASESQTEALAGKKSCGGGTLTDATCKADLHAAYPNGDPDWYGQGTPRKPTPVSDATLAKCCEQLYFKNGSNMGTPELHDSGCCTILRLANSPTLGLACTPWGPPMPVAMPHAMRRRRGIA